MIKILFHVKTALVLHIRCCPYLGTINKYINSIILNRFYWWSKTLPHPLFLTNNIKIDGISIKLKWETHNLFTLNFKFWRYIDYNNLWHIYSPSIFISCFTLAFTSADLKDYQLFRLSFNISNLKKTLLSQIFLLKGTVKW